jgi:hypothetical protein
LCGTAAQESQKTDSAPRACCELVEGLKLLWWTREAADRTVVKKPAFAETEGQTHASSLVQ